MIIYCVFIVHFGMKGHGEVDHCYFKERDALRRANQLNGYYMTERIDKVAVVIQRYVH